jgi:uncharacterized membrane protein
MDPSPSELSLVLKKTRRFRRLVNTDIVATVLVVCRLSLVAVFILLARQGVMQKVETFDIFCSAAFALLTVYESFRWPQT